MESRSVNLKEIKKGNPRLCLSPKRFLGKCYDCPLYENCESKIINKKYEAKLKKKRKLQDKINKLTQEIKEL